jgi:hypothetical protein
MTVTEKKDFLVRPESPLVIVSLGTLVEMVSNLIHEGRSHVCFGIGHAVQLDAPSDYLICVTGCDGDGTAGGQLHGLQARRISSDQTDVKPATVMLQ